MRQYFEERDRLRLVVSYRRTFLDTLLQQGEEEAEQVREEYQQADARTHQEYEDTGAEMESKRRLSDEEESELKKLWRVPVKLFHLDRFADDPEKQATCTKLMAAINTAMDITEREPDVFERVVEQQIDGVNAELTHLKTEADRLAPTEPGVLWG